LIALPLLLLAAVVLGIVLGAVGSRLLARWLVQRAYALAHQLGGAIPTKLCARDCGRSALSNHPTCGSPRCVAGWEHDQSVTKGGQP
jgi:hypothetical protein